MKLSEIGEFGFIDRVADMFRHLSQQGLTGIGDDCAILPFNETEDYVITTDLLIENIHFLKNRIKPDELGYKALAVNLSDIAAMGAQPVGSFLSVGIPADTSVEYLDAFMQGYHSLSEKYNVPLLGGDTTRSVNHLVINVAVTGRCEKGKARLRSIAQTDDIICVTGFLGDSAAGLEVLLNNLPENNDHIKLIRSHHLPEPHLKEGIWLAQQPAVHAMMDVSDGIASDLVHIVKTSGKSAVVELNQLPVSDVLKRVAASNNWDLEKLALSGGEDYVLLCTVEKNSFAKLNPEFTLHFGRPLYAIGHIANGCGEIRWTKNGKAISLVGQGFDHFKS